LPGNPKELKREKRSITEERDRDRVRVREREGCSKALPGQAYKDNENNLTTLSTIHWGDRPMGLANNQLLAKIQAVHFERLNK